MKSIIDYIDMGSNHTHYISKRVESQTPSNYFYRNQIKTKLKSQSLLPKKTNGEIVTS